MASWDAPWWREAINNELDFVMSNHLWKLVVLPLDTKLIGCKWNFQRKMKVDGSFWYLCSCDADCIIAIHNWHIYFMDVKTTYLKVNLNVKIYIRQ